MKRGHLVAFLDIKDRNYSILIEEVFQKYLKFVIKEEHSISLSSSRMDCHVNVDDLQTF